MSIRKKGGRPRKLDQARTANGRLKRAPKPAATQEALAKRAELVGEALAMGDIPGRASALLRHWDVITDRQADALEKYRAAVMVYRRTRLIPKSAAKIVTLDVMPELAEGDAPEERQGVPDEEADARRAKQRMDDVRRILSTLRFPLLAREMLEMFAIEDFVPPAWRERCVAPAALLTLRQATNAIADYFRLGKG